MEKAEAGYLGFSSECAFDREHFLSPCIDYSPVYTWMWNDRITEEGIRAQLDEMLRLGIKRFYILPMPKSFRPTSFPTPLEPAYLSDGYLRLYRYALEQAASRGMQVWLYDEGGWPSGGACGQVMLEDPSLVQETIRVEEYSLPKDTPYAPCAEVEIAFCGENRIAAGEIFPEERAITEYKRVKTSFPRVTSADYPDITKEGATDLFLKLTHDRYDEALGGIKGAGIRAIFTDEPTAPRPFPYTDEIKEAFLAHFGEPIEPYLPLLTGKVAPTEKTAKIKIAFYRMMSELFCERVLEKERERAHRAGVPFAGHLDKDDEANGSMTGGSFGLLGALRRFDVPGVDAIRRQIFPPKGKEGLYGENKFFPRLASSAAAQSGGRHALTESFAVYGNGLSYDEMRYVLNFQAMRGINLFNMMVFPYGRKGALQAGLLPHFDEALFSDLKPFNDYLTRLSYLFSLGDRVADTALYYPVEDGILYGASALASYESTGRTMEKRGILFDIIDDEALLAADPRALQEGVLKMGKAAYKRIVLPQSKHLSDGGIRALRTFLAHGGELITTERDQAETLGATFLPDLSSMPSPRPVAEEDISYAEAALTNGKLAFLMNESGENKRVTLAVGARAPYLIRPSEGSILSPSHTEGEITFDLAEGELVGLLFTEQAIPCDAPFDRKESVILREWSYRRIERLVVNESAARLPLAEEEQALTDASEPFGADFSGSVLYRTTFTLPAGRKRALLDLGRVAGTAEVLLNGISLGVKVMAPYRFEIPSDLLQEVNALTVRVTNTAANEYAHTKAFDRYPAWRLGNYFEEETRFHRDSLKSGLLGEVRVFYE